MRGNEGMILKEIAKRTYRPRIPKTVGDASVEELVANFIVNDFTLDSILKHWKNIQHENYFTVGEEETLELARQFDAVILWAKSHASDKTVYEPNLTKKTQEYIREVQEDGGIA